MLRSPLLRQLRRSPLPLRRSSTASAPHSHGLCSLAPTSAVLLTEVENVKIHALNRPKALNALNLEMIEYLYVGCVVLSPGAAAGRAFCAGGDIRWLYDQGISPRGQPCAQMDFFRAEYTLNHLIGTYTKPQVAWLDGIVMGGGVGLSVHGRFRVATPSSVFAMPETGIGFFPDVGGSYFLPRLRTGLGCVPLNHLEGARLKGPELVWAGVATHYVPDASRLDSFCRSLETVQAVDASVVDHRLSAFAAEKVPVSSVPIAAHGKFLLLNAEDAIARCFGEAETLQDVYRALEAENSEWSRATLKTLGKACPVSVAVTFEALMRGADLSLASCLQMEFRIARGFMAHSDFFEGVGALLVEKRPAIWGSSLETVEANDFFEPVGDNEGGGDLQLESAEQVSSAL